MLADVDYYPFSRPDADTATAAHAGRLRFPNRRERLGQAVQLRAPSERVLDKFVYTRSLGVIVSAQLFWMLHGSELPREGAEKRVCGLSWKAQDGDPLILGDTLVLRPYIPPSAWLDQCNLTVSPTLVEVDV